MVTYEAVKAFLLSMVIIAFLSALLALPLWPLWELGPHAIGAPTIGYLTIAACLGFIGVAGFTLYLGAGFVRAMVKTIVDEL